MSLGIAFKGPEGLVLAADSRVTLTRELTRPVPGGGTVNMVLPSFFDNATKLFKVKGAAHGVVTYGVGAIGGNEPRTAHSFLPEFEDELAQNPTGTATVAGFAQLLSDFFLGQWQASMPAAWVGGNMTFLVGGFNPNEPYGRIYEIGVPGAPTPVEQKPGEFGVVWGGMPEVTSRLLNGYDLKAVAITKDLLGLTDQQASDLAAKLADELAAPIPYQFLPLQDCVDLAIFLVRTTAELQSWQVDVRGVGGAIDVATITRTAGFVYLQQKAVVGQRS